MDKKPVLRLAGVDQFSTTSSADTSEGDGYFFRGFALAAAIGIAFWAAVVALYYIL